MTGAPAPAGPGTALVELRVLDGPNLYFPRPAIKLTLDVAGLLGLPEGRAAEAAAALPAGVPGGRAGHPGASGPPAAAAVGPAGSERRRRFATRLLAHLTRRVAAAAGVRALAVRSRPGPEPTQVVVAYPWRRLHSAEVPGRSVN
jgi:cyanophycin synthetase